MNQDTYRRCQQEWEKDGMQMCEGPENTCFLQDYKPLRNSLNQ